jgi:alpha-beta hydrolase superfamily lysophospholipase
LCKYKNVNNENINNNQEIRDYVDLDSYSIESLSKTNIKPGLISIDKQINSNDNFTSYLFSFKFYPNPENGETKKTSGIINIPSKSISKMNKLVILIRGYVDQKSYKPGDGSKRIGEYLAGKGYVTIAPDFLGYGDSDSESGNIFESRFQTYTTILSLEKSLELLSSNTSLLLGPIELTKLLTNPSQIFIWAHSNGGQIALTSLEISGKDYPTALWAPVTKPFPYSILYYTDESDDRGRLIRSELSKFEKYHNVENYSLTNYLNMIKAPISLHQGTSDDSVPLDWSNKFFNELKNLNKEITYFKYPNSDHNLMPEWNRAAENTLNFFNSFSSSRIDI